MITLVGGPICRNKNVIQTNHFLIIIQQLYTFVFFLIFFVCLEFRVVGRINKQFYTLLYFCKNKMFD
jgi:hypothetical protein